MEIPIATDFKTIADAREHVKKKYLFNSSNYPALANLTDPLQIECFTAKHCLMHIHKSIPTIVLFADGKPFFMPRSERHRLLRLAFARIAVNAMAMEIAHGTWECATEEDIEAYEKRFNESEAGTRLFTMLVESIVKVAEYYEQVDHGHVSEQAPDESLRELVAAAFFCHNQMIGSHEEFLNFLPTTMKSK